MYRISFISDKCPLKLSISDDYYPQLNPDIEGASKRINIYPDYDDPYNLLSYLDVFRNPELMPELTNQTGLDDETLKEIIELNFNGHEHIAPCYGSLMSEYKHLTNIRHALEYSTANAGVIAGLDLVDLIDLPPNSTEYLFYYIMCCGLIGCVIAYYQEYKDKGKPYSQFTDPELKSDALEKRVLDIVDKGLLKNDYNFGIVPEIIKNVNEKLKAVNVDSLSRKYYDQLCKHINDSKITRLTPILKSCDFNIDVYKTKSDFKIEFEVILPYSCIKDNDEIKIYKTVKCSANGLKNGDVRQVVSEDEGWFQF